MNKISRWIWIFYTKFMKLKSCGKKSCIYRPMQISNPKGISIGSNVFICDYSWLIGAKNTLDTGLEILDNTTIGHFSHIVSKKEVKIGKNVLIADKVFISDCTHNYKDIEIPIQNQEIEFIQPVSIGDDSWIGENVCICGASVGKHCIVGANSVVLSNIPDYSVAVGAPAKVVKKYNNDIKEWILI